MPPPFLFIPLLPDLFRAIDELDPSIHLIGDTGEIPIVAGNVDHGVQPIQGAVKIAAHGLDQLLDSLFIQLFDPIGELRCAVTKPSTRAGTLLCSVTEPL